MIPLLLALAACTPLATSWESRQEFPIRQADTLHEAPVDPDTVRVLTWNIKFGGARIDFFFDGWDDRVHMSEEEVLANLDGLLALLDEVDPDVLLVQEIDVGSKRSAYVDQVREIMDGHGFDYAAFVPVWKAQYVAEEGLGRVHMGQAVFSRWPITRNTRVDLPQSGSQSGLVNYFYLHRAIQVTEIDLGGDEPLVVINNHPDAYALDGTKIVHLGMIANEARDAGGPLVVGGDLNVVPPGSLLTEEFPDVPEIEGPGVSEVVYTEEEMDALLPLYERYQAAVPLEDYRVETLEEQERYFTHSISGEVFWTQKLDYLFTDLSWGQVATLQAPGDLGLASDPMTLSDHAPLFGELVRR